MTPSSAPQISIRSLPAIRIAAIAILSILGALLDHWGLTTVKFIPFLGALAFAGIVSIVFLARHDSSAERSIWIQLVLDVCTVTALVGASGGAKSLFTFLYVLTILAASSMLPPTASLRIAALASFLYAGIVLVPPIVRGTPFPDSIGPEGLLAFTLVINSTVFFLVALIGTVLARRLQSAHQALSAQQENLDDLQAFNALLFQSMGAGLVAIDKHGNLTAINRAAEEITGFDASEIIGRPFESVVGPEIHFPELWKDITLSGNRQSRRYETRVRRRDGEETPLGISFSPLLSGKGHLVGLIGICRDLTDIKQADRQVRIQDRLATVGRLAGNIAHEIRNPLASLSGAIELLAQERTDDDTRERLMEIVLRESDRLNRTIVNFLEYARPEALQLYPGNLAEILDEVLAVMERRPQAGAAVKFVREFPPELPVLLDPQQVRQAFLNLCLNSIEAMPEGGELRIKSEQVQRSGDLWTEIQVSDTGHGIQSADLPHIFEPFFSTKPQGSGLGLALVHRMVQDHGGEIEVKSELGKGTTVLLLLPQDSTLSIQRVKHG